MVALVEGALGEPKPNIVSPTVPGVTVIQWLKRSAVGVPVGAVLNTMTSPAAIATLPVVVAVVAAAPETVAVKLSVVSFRRIEAS